MAAVELVDGWAWPLRHRAERRGRAPIALTAREAELLAYLARAAPRVVALAELHTEVWGAHPDLRSHTVQTLVYTLRQKLEPEPARPRLLLTVRGAGYRWAPPGAAARPPDHLARVLAGLEDLVTVAPDAAVAGWRSLLAGRALGPLDAAWAHGAIGAHQQRAGDLAAAAVSLAAAESALAEAPMDAAPGARKRRVEARVHMLRGMLAWRGGHLGDAIASFMAAEQGAPGLARMHLGLARRTLGELGAAEAAFAQATPLVQEHGEGLGVLTLLRAEALWANGREAAAGDLLMGMSGHPALAYPHGQRLLAAGRAAFVPDAPRGALAQGQPREHESEPVVLEALGAHRHGDTQALSAPAVRRWMQIDPWARLVVEAMA